MKTFFKCMTLARGRTFALALLFCCLVSSAAAQDPIVRVHGGSMTFFATPLWNPERTPAGSGYCATVSRADLAQLRFDGFYPDTTSFARQPARPTPVMNSGEWRLEFRGHQEEEVTAFRAAQDGIAMQASFRGCDGKPGASLHLSPLGRAGFYPSDLVPAGIYKSNKRFASQCKVDRDRCERMAHVQLFDHGSSTPSLKLACPDGACAVFVGKKGFTTDPTRSGPRPR